MRRLIEQFLRFGMVGVLAAFGHYGTLILLVELAGAGAVVGALSGYLVGGGIAYVLNRRWTFDSDVRHHTALVRFVVVTAIGFLLTGLCMSVLDPLMAGLPIPLVPQGQRYLLAQLVTTGIVMVWSFWANKLWTFGPAAGAMR